MGALEALFGVGALGGAGTGVGEDLAVTGTGVSAPGCSATFTGRLNDWLACKAVVRIALNSNMLFCRFFPSPNPDVALRLAVSASSGRPSSSPSGLGRWSDVSSISLPPCFLPSSGNEGSEMGQAKPVRGVYIGRRVRKMSIEVCKECKDVSYVAVSLDCGREYILSHTSLLDNNVYTSGDW